MLASLRRHRTFLDFSWGSGKADDEELEGGLFLSGVKPDPVVEEIVDPSVTGFCNNIKSRRGFIKHNRSVMDKSNK